MLLTNRLGFRVKGRLLSSVRARTLLRKKVLDLVSLSWSVWRKHGHCWLTQVLLQKTWRILLILKLLRNYCRCKLLWAHADWLVVVAVSKMTWVVASGHFCKAWDWERHVVRIATLSQRRGGEVKSLKLLRLILTRCRHTSCDLVANMRYSLAMDALLGKRSDLVRWDCVSVARWLHTLTDLTSLCLLWVLGHHLAIFYQRRLTSQVSCSIDVSTELLLSEGWVSDVATRWY